MHFFKENCPKHILEREIAIFKRHFYFGGFGTKKMMNY